MAYYELTSSNVAGGPAYEWIDISATGERLLTFKTDDTAVVQRSIGFAFPFYGTSYNNLYISGQGFAALVNPGSGFPQEFRAPLPNPAGYRALLSPYQQYLEPEVLGDVYFKSFATHAVVQWEQVKVFGFDIRPSFQVVIYPDGSIRFNYKTIPLTSGGANVAGYLSGIQNAAGDSGIGASWYNASQQGLQLHNLDPVSLRFAAPAVAPAPWVTTTSTTAGGDPLSWDFVIQASGLQPGTHQADFTMRKAGGPVLYSRPLRLTVLPFGTSGIDTMTGTTGDDTFGGLGGNDTLNGMAGNDTLDGGSGDDILTGGTGDDQLAGGDGKDVYHYALGDGNDTYSDNAGVHQANDATADYSDLYFGAGIEPGMLRSSYHPADAQNPSARIRFTLQHPSGGSVNVTSWNSTSGSTGVGTSRRWRFHFQDGTVWGGELFWTSALFSYPFEGFTGGVGNDLISGTSAAESLRGLAGDDFLQGGDGWDSYYYQWGDGNDTIQDTPLSGQLSLLYIFGTALHDRLTFDYIAPDSLRVNVSHPTDPSKDGSILLKEWYKTSPFVAKDNWRLYVQNASGGWTDLSMPLRLMSTNGPDNMQLALNYTGHGNSFDAGAGNDTLYGTQWNETLYGSEGDDLIYANSGNDVVDGGEGNDTLNGGNDHDTLLGGTGDDVLMGDAGDDDLFGGDGNDILAGGNDNDLLEGGAGDDQLSGEAGNDTLRGGTGNDALSGGTGNDVYEWNLGDGHDTITDTIQESAPGIENQLHFGTGVDAGRIQIVMGPDRANASKFITP